MEQTVKTPIDEDLFASVALTWILGTTCNCPLPGPCTCPAVLE